MVSSCAKRLIQAAFIYCKASENDVYVMYNICNLCNCSALFCIQSFLIQHALISDFKRKCSEYVSVFRSSLLSRGAEDQVV